MRRHPSRHASVVIPVGEIDVVCGGSATSLNFTLSGNTAWFGRQTEKSMARVMFFTAGASTDSHGLLFLS